MRMGGMMGMMAGSALSTAGRKLIRLVTTGLMLSGVGMAGVGFYGQNLPPQAQAAQAFAQQHWQIIIALGVGAVALGAMLNFWASHRMTKQMTAGMGGMGGGNPMMGMQGMAGFPGMPVAKDVVKVRCRSCGTLQDEAAEFCSKCGKSMSVSSPA
jgi:hypothetical protein